MFVLVSQRPWHICSIDGRNVCDVFPIFSLQILVVKAWWSVISWIFSNFPVLLDGHGFFCNIDLLIESLLASYHLEHKVIKLYSVLLKVCIWTHNSYREYFYYILDLSSTFASNILAVLRHTIISGFSETGQTNVVCWLITNVHIGLTSLRATTEDGRQNSWRDCIREFDTVWTGSSRI